MSQPIDRNRPSPFIDARTPSAPAAPDHDVAHAHPAAAPVPAERVAMPTPLRPTAQDSSVADLLLQLLRSAPVANLSMQLEMNEAMRAAFAPPARDGRGELIDDTEWALLDGRLDANGDPVPFDEIAFPPETPKTPEPSERYTPPHR